MTSMYEKRLILVRTGFTNIQNCTIGFICRWVLSMFLLFLYFRLLDDIGKPASRQAYVHRFLCDLCGSFLLSTDFLALFSHDNMSCSHSTCTWLNLKNHPPIRFHYPVDQRSHASHLQALHHLLLFGELFCCDFSFHTTSTSSGVSFKSISNVHH